MENIGDWKFNILWIPWVNSFPNNIEHLLLAYPEISYGDKRKCELELKLTFFNLKYEKSTKTQSTNIIFWANPACELLSFLLSRYNKVNMQPFGILNSFFSVPDQSLLSFQDERRW